jgi:hypothetical protein
MIQMISKFFLLSFLLAMGGSVNAQGILKKMKDKTNEALERAANKAIGKEVEDKTGIPTGTNEQSSGSPRNKGGGGLTNTEPPDVKANMAEAEKLHGSAQYSNARFALQQALMGVEIQLGKEILESLPKTVSGLPYDETLDRVASSQWGWSNLTIQRVYTDKKDKQLTIGIGNAGIYGGLAQMYFANAGMVQAYGDQQNVKNVMVKGNKGIIQYDDSRGYTLIIGIGQAGGIVWEAINFSTEEEVMSAANSFDIDKIKKILGEQ